MYTHVAETAPVIPHPPITVGNAEIFETLRPLAATLDIDQQDLEMTRSLFLPLDHETAIGSVRIVSVGLKIGKLIGDFYDSPEVDETAILLDSLLHDNGKANLRPELMAISNFGAYWDDDLAIEMQGHVLFGGQNIRTIGMNETHARVTEETHGKQLSRFEYGMGNVLDLRERITCDVVRVTDFAEAMLTRDNTRNRGLSHVTKAHCIGRNTLYVFDDYDGGQVLGGLVAQLLLDELAPGSDTNLADLGIAA